MAGVNPVLLGQFQIRLEAENAGSMPRESGLVKTGAKNKR